MEAADHSSSSPRPGTYGVNSNTTCSNRNWSRPDGTRSRHQTHTYVWHRDSYVLHLVRTRETSGTWSPRGYKRTMLTRGIRLSRNCVLQLRERHAVSKPERAGPRSAAHRRLSSSPAGIGCDSRGRG